MPEKMLPYRSIQLYIIDYLFIFYIYSIYARVCIYTYIHNKQSTDTDAIQGPVLSHLLLSTGLMSSWASGFSMAFCNQGIHAFLPGQLCGPSARCIQRWLIPCESHIFPWYNSIVVFPIEINWVEFKVHLLPFTPIYFRPSFHGYSIHYLSLNHPPRPTSAASARTPHARPSPLRRLLHVISHVGLIRFNLVEPCLNLTHAYSLEVDDTQ